MRISDWSSDVCSSDLLSRDQEDVAALYKRLNFAGVTIVTLAEGEISELHVGLKGTMNALFLKDLARKTHRGLRGRVEKGFSAGPNAYGYRIVRRLSSEGELVRGEREVDPAEALIVERIFRDRTGVGEGTGVAVRVDLGGG